MLQDRPFNDPDVPTVYSNEDGFGARVILRADEAVIAVAGEIDLATATLLSRAIQDASRHCRRVIIDMADTTFIDSTGLHTLVQAHHDLGPAHKTLALRSINPNLRRAFEITGVDELVAVLPDPT
jgi:anti-anti-sigma factor